MKLVKFAMKQFNINPKVKIKYKDIKHYAEVKPTKKGYTLTISTRYPMHPKTVFHECAHIMQFELKGLVYNEGIMLYDGQEHKGTDYWWFPWEIEARGLEEALYQTWLTRKKKKKHSKNTPEPRSPTLHSDSESLKDQ